jgi:hypothetical protein
MEKMERLSKEKAMDLLLNPHKISNTCDVN